MTLTDNIRLNVAMFEQKDRVKQIQTVGRETRSERNGNHPDQLRFQGLIQLTSDNVAQDKRRATERRQEAEHVATKFC